MMKDIGFIGLGKMGTALALAIIEKKSQSNHSIFVYDPHLEISKKEFLKSKYPNFIFCEEVTQVEEGAEYIFICVKPQDASLALKACKGEKKYISIVAGLNIESLASLLKTKRENVSRVMPNLAVEIQQSVNAVYCEGKELRDWTLEAFSFVGYTFALRLENDLHAITAQSGSGPAIVCAFVQGMAEGGVINGLGYEQALKITIEMMKGTLALLEEKALTPTQLRNQVASPGGTTIFALEKLEASGWQGGIMQALIAAEKRSRDLSKL